MSNKAQGPNTRRRKGFGSWIFYLIRHLDFDTGISHKGFGLIELIVVVGLITLVAVSTAVSLSTFRGQSNLSSTREGVLDALRVARARTLASENASSYGVYLESATYTTFMGRLYAAGAASNEPQRVPDGVEIVNIQLSTTSPSVVFDRLTGNTSTTGTLDMRLAADPARFETIRIESSGQAYVLATTVMELNTRVSDTRHLHFDLGWSMQNAATLRLRFSDPPNPDIVSDIEMAPYFNAAKTSFFWEGDTDVYGTSQHVKVYTHALDAINTLLSVNRDLRYNTKALAVSIIDGGTEKQIVSYAAGGTATVGAYGGTMDQQ